MALRAFTGFEYGVLNTSAVGSNLDVGGSGTGATIVTTSPKSGTYCGRINASTGQNYFTLLDYTTIGTAVENTFNIASSYIQFYFKYATKNTTGKSLIASISDTGGVTKIFIHLGSDGKLIAIASDNTTVIENGSTILSADTWYKINLRCDTGATAVYELKVDDAVELSGTYNLTTNNATYYSFGSVASLTEAVDFFYDDIILDDAAYPDGNAVVKAILPIANGSTMSWSAGTNTSDYTQIDAIPLDVNEYIMSPTTGNPNLALFDMEACATKEISGTILGLKALATTRENTSVTSSTILRVKSGATNSDNSAYNGGTAFVGRAKLLPLDPNTSSAWTTTTIDAVEIGLLENNAVSNRCCSIVGMVAYIPSTVLPNTSNFFQLF